MSDLLHWAMTHPIVPSLLIVLSFFAFVEFWFRRLNKRKEQEPRE